VSGPFNPQAFDIAFGFRSVERKRGFRQKTDARVDYMQPCSHNGIKLGSASHVRGSARVDSKGRWGDIGGFILERKEEIITGRSVEPKKSVFSSRL
jgi:hypothetical protein